MLDQAVPIGINLTSPATWFAVAVGLIVLALTVATRRGIARPRSGSGGGQIGPMSGDARTRYTDEWAAAQALFVENPRTGRERARTIVTSVLAARGFPLETPELLDRRYGAGCEIAARADASTDDLRAAFIEFQAVFDALLAARH